MSKIKLGKTGVEVIKEWVIKTFLKQQPKGVLTTLPKKDFVELNTGITAERLMRNGVDPNSIKNVDQVENIINQLNKPRAVAADSPEGKGITEALFGKRGQVIEADFGKPFSEEVKNVKKRIDSGVATTVEKMLAMEPIDAMKEANKVIKREGPYKNLSQKDARNILDSTEDHIFERNIKSRETDINFDEGATDEVTKAYNDAVKKGKFKGTEEDFRNKIDNMMDEDFAIGGRVGFKGGADMGTVDSETRKATAKSVNVSPSGNVTTSKDKGPDPVDDRGSSDQNMVQMLVNAGYTPREIRSITNPSAIDKIKNSPMNNPVTRGILRAGAYTLNPSLGAVDFRKAMQLKNLYDYTKDQINEPVTEEDLTLGLITDTQKNLIDKQGKIGKLTGAFDPDQTFEAAKKFDDKGSGGVFGIGGREAEPMTREEFDAYVKEKGFAIGGRVGLKDGNGIADEEAENARFAKRVRELMDEGFDMGEAVREAMKEGYADGGRIGLKKGMDRRTFMKIMGGLTTIPVFGKFFKGAEVAAPVVEKAAEVASGAPPYFFNLVNRIRALGKKSSGPKERSETYTYEVDNRKYEMQVDNDTGQIEISKQNLGYDERFGEGIVSEEYMTIRPGQADETTRGKKVVDEYEEYTGFTDQEGKLKDVEPGVSDNTVMDGSISKEELEQEIIEQLSKESPSIKKASGGIARMLGE